MCRHREHNCKACWAYPFWISPHPDAFLDQRRRENSINTSWSNLYWISPEGVILENSDWYAFGRNIISSKPKLAVILDAMIFQLWERCTFVCVVYTNLQILVQILNVNHETHLYPLKRMSWKTHLSAMHTFKQWRWSHSGGLKKQHRNRAMAG